MATVARGLVPLWRSANAGPAGPPGPAANAVIASGAKLLAK
jgi:hypothetical protein